MNEDERNVNEEEQVEDEQATTDEATVERPAVDPSAMSDQVKVELNYAGPDPAVWGNDEDRPSGPADGPDPNGAPLGEVRYEDLSERTLADLKNEAPGIKASSKAALVEHLQELGKGTIAGPGSEWEKDDDGNYVNR